MERNHSRSHFRGRGGIGNAFHSRPRRVSVIQALICDTHQLFRPLSGSYFFLPIWSLSSPLPRCLTTSVKTGQNSFQMTLSWRIVRPRRLSHRKKKSAFIRSSVWLSDNILLRLLSCLFFVFIHSSFLPPAPCGSRLFSTGVTHIGKCVIERYMNKKKKQLEDVKTRVQH